MSHDRTHREVTEPRISARHLADYMAASERVKRSIVRACKYQAIARVTQHNEAKEVISRAILAGDDSCAESLVEEAERIRGRLSADPFERDLIDHNADYVERFAQVLPCVALPTAERMPSGSCPSIDINGVRVTVEIHTRLRRVTRTNNVRTGAVMLRYAKGSPLSPAVAEWQSAFLFGYLRAMSVISDEGLDPEQRLCITLDAYSGRCHPAPGDSVRRYLNMEAACEAISQRWVRIAPPGGAII